MKDLDLNRFDKCKFNYGGGEYIGYLIAKQYKNPDDFFYLIYCEDFAHSHNGVFDYDNLLRQGYDLYVTKEEYLSLVKINKLWYVDYYFFIEMIKAQSNNRPIINVLVDENGKIVIQKN